MSNPLDAFTAKDIRTCIRILTCIVPDKEQLNDLKAKLSHRLSQGEDLKEYTPPVGEFSTTAETKTPALTRRQRRLMKKRGM